MGGRFCMRPMAELGRVAAVAGIEDADDGAVGCWGTDEEAAAAASRSNDRLWLAAAAGTTNRFFSVAVEFGCHGNAGAVLVRAEGEEGREAEAEALVQVEAVSMERQRLIALFSRSPLVQGSRELALAGAGGEEHEGEEEDGALVAAASGGTGLLLSNNLAASFICTMEDWTLKAKRQQKILIQWQDYSSIFIITQLSNRQTLQVTISSLTEGPFEWQEAI